MTKESVIKILNEKINNHEIGMSNGKMMGMVTGALGDTINCESIYDGRIEPEEGGMFSRFIGCSYLFRTHPLNEITEGLGLSKSFISALPREIISKNLFYELAILLTYIFNRKKFYYELRVFSWNLYYHIIHKFGDLEEKKYSVPVRELRRAALKIIGQKIKPEELHWYKNQNDENNLVIGFYNLIKFIGFFIEFDNAYRFRIQDAFENIKKENIEKNVIKEIERILDLMIERENPISGGIKYKWIRMKKLIIPALYLMPQIRKLIKELLLEIDFDKMKLDESDWYFCLKRIGYRFRGMSYRDRMRLRRKIDKEKGHISVKIQIDEKNNKADINIFNSMRTLYPIKNNCVISQSFGVNKDFYLKNFGVNGHNGIDIVSYHGDKILCPEDGFVYLKYDLTNANITAGFGLHIISNPDENGICNEHIIWHTMSDIKLNVGDKIYQGDTIAHEGDSGAVYVGGIAVPDSEKGFHPYPGTHLHWGIRKVLRTNDGFNHQGNALSDGNGIVFKDSEGYFYQIQDYDNGYHGCIDPLKEDLVYYDEWKKEMVIEESLDIAKKSTEIVPTLPEEEQSIWMMLIQKIIEKVGQLLKLK